MPEYLLPERVLALALDQGLELERMLVQVTVLAPELGQVPEQVTVLALATELDLALERVPVLALVLEQIVQVLEQVLVPAVLAVQMVVYLHR